MTSQGNHSSEAVFTEVGKDNKGKTALRNRLEIQEKTLSEVAVYANYIGPPVMTDANSVGPVKLKGSLYEDEITENDRCVIKIIGLP